MPFDFNDADQREAAMAEKWAECCEENTSLRQKLAAFQSAVEHVTEDGKTRRSFVAMPEGWAMIHKDRLHDLEVAEERLAAMLIICKAKNKAIKVLLIETGASMTYSLSDSIVQRAAREAFELEADDTTLRMWLGEQIEIKDDAIKAALEHMNVPGWIEFETNQDASNFHAAANKLAKALGH